MHGNTELIGEQRKEWPTVSEMTFTIKLMEVSGSKYDLQVNSMFC